MSSLHDNSIRRYLFNDASGTVAGIRPISSRGVLMNRRFVDFLTS